MINWKRLVKQIPISVSIAKEKYEIVWIQDFKDGTTLGETRFDPKQIVIKSNESPKLTVHVYIHEVIHAISNEFNIGLTESQVLALEEALSTILKKDNVFKAKE